MIAPKQKLSKKEKEANNFQWYKDNGKYIREQSDFYSDDRAEMIELYKAAYGELDKASYKYVLNPYNTTDENVKNYPARLRNYDKIIPILNVFLGEKADKPFNHNAIVTNADSPNKNKDDMDKAFTAVMAQHFVNFLNDQGEKTGVESKEIPPYEKVLKEYQVGATDKRALFAQEAVEFIKHNLSLKDKYQEAYYDWLVVGRAFTYKDVYKNDLLFEVVPPLEFWHGTTRTGFVEDAQWCHRRTRYGLNDVIDRFHEVLDPKDIVKLEAKYRNGDGTSFSDIAAVNISIDSQVDNGQLYVGNLLEQSKGLINVYHNTWKGFVKIGILQYIDEMGGLQEMEVSDDYKLNKENGDVSIEWTYNSMIYENYEIDEDIFVYNREAQVQRQELANSSVCKQPYNGRAGYSERDKINSIVKQCLPYQSLINIYHYRRELVIAKNKDKMTLMPMGLIPDGDGWTQEKWLYYIDTTGIGFFDETKPNAAAAIQYLKAIDLSLGNYIDQLNSLIRETAAEMQDAIGMNRQRAADIKTSDGKGNTDQAINRSSTISREMNRRFERFQEIDLQGLVENSKYAWIDGKKGPYINSEGRKAFLEIDGAKWLDTEVGVFIVDSDQEYSKLNQAKDFAFGIAQKNGTPYSTVLEVIDSNNMSKLKAIVNKAEQIQQEYEQAQAEQAQKGQETIKQMEAAKEDKTNQVSIEKEHIKAEASIQVALIQKSGDSESPNKDENDLKAYDDYINKTKDNDLVKQREGLKNGDKAANKRLEEAKLQEAILKRESAERIATKNKNKYD